MEESVFLKYIRSIFNKWAGFQAAIDAGMGEPYAREKEKWLGNEIENYFKLFGDITPQEVEEYLGTILEHEFDTYFEDGSLRQVSILLCTAYPISLANPDADIFKEISMEQNNATEEVPCTRLQQLSINRIGNEEDEGWTQVTRKGRH